VIIRLTIAPVSGNGEGAVVTIGEEPFGAFEVASLPHPQSDAHKKISGTILLGCIDYLSEWLFAFADIEFHM
jgi:hypothetical protein